MENDNLSPTQVEMAKTKVEWETKQTKEALRNYLIAQGENLIWLKSLRVESSHKG